MFDAFDAVVGWISGPLVQQITAIMTFFVLLGAFLAACYARYRWVRKSLDKKIVCRRIVSAADPDLDRVTEFHDTYFNDPRLAGHDPNFKKWIGEYEELVAEGGPIEWEEYLIEAKTFLSGRIVGYLYASFHTEMRYVFVSYFRTNSEFGTGLCPVGMKLLRYLVRCVEEIQLSPCDPGGRKFRGLVGELDLEEREVRVNARHFGGLAKMLGYRAYTIEGIDYRQPVIELDEIRRQRRLGTNVPTAGGQLLLYVPATPAATDTSISRKEAEDLLRFIVTEVYPDSYDTDEEAWNEYMAYATQLYDDLSARLEEDVSVRLVGR